jgi:hypothetical protein
MKEVMVKIKWMNGDAFQIFKKKIILGISVQIRANHLVWPRIIFFWRFVSRRRSSILFWLGVFSENVNHVHKRKN